MQVALANPGHVVLEKIHASHLAKTVGDDMIFLSIGDAVVTLGHSNKSEP